MFSTLKQEKNINEWMDPVIKGILSSFPVKIF